MACFLYWTIWIVIHKPQQLKRSKSRKFLQHFLGKIGTELYFQSNFLVAGCWLIFFPEIFFPKQFLFCLLPPEFQFGNPQLPLYKRGNDIVSHVVTTLPSSIPSLSSSQSQLHQNHISWFIITIRKNCFNIGVKVTCGPKGNNGSVPQWNLAYLHHHHGHQQQHRHPHHHQQLQLLLQHHWNSHDDHHQTLNSGHKILGSVCCPDNFLKHHGCLNVHNLVAWMFTTDIRFICHGKKVAERRGALLAASDGVINGAIYRQTPPL